MRDAEVKKSDGAIAPWLIGKHFDVPAELLAQAWPSRRFPGAAPEDRPLPCWQDFCDHAQRHATLDFKESDRGFHAAMHEAQARIDNGTMTGSMQSDLVLMAIGIAFERFHDGCAAFTHFLVASKGLPYALDVLLELQRVHFHCDYGFAEKTTTVYMGGYTLPSYEGYDTTGFGWSATELAFRTHLAHADEAIWKQCVDTIASRVHGLAPERQPLLGLLLPDVPEFSDRLALTLAVEDAPDAITWLALSATAPKAMLAARSVNRVNREGSQRYYRDPRWIATLLQERGVDAVPALEDGAFIAIAGDALGHIGTPEAIRALALAKSHGKEAHARFVAAVKRWPLAGVAALAELSADSSTKGAFDALLDASAQPIALHLPAIAQWVSPRAGKVLDALLVRMAAPLEFATPDELPRVLANPPWLVKRKKGAAALALSPLPLAPEQHWPQEQQAKVLKRGAYDNTWTRPDSHTPGHLAERLGFPNGEPWDAAVAAITANDANALVTAWNASPKRSARSSLNMWAAVQLPAGMGAQVWNALAHEAHSSCEYEMAVFGLAGLPGLVTACQLRPAQDLPVALYFAAVELAVPVARALVQVKACRVTARQWLLAYPEYAACGLIAPALGKAGVARDCAAVALRLLAAEGHATLLADVAARYGKAEVTNALREVLTEDLLERYPTKLSKAPAFWNPSFWTRPVLASNGKALPDEVLDHIGTMLRFPTADGIYAGIADLRAACTPGSLAGFAWSLFNAWLDAGAPPKEGWAYQALGLIGDDDTARKLVPYLRAWPSEGQHLRAVAGLDVLANIGSDTALMHLHGMSQRGKSRPLKDRALEKIAAVATARELTTEEMEDRLVPDLGLDDQGSLLLDFGPRQFRVGFDAHLKPFVRDMEGARLADLPAPRQSDNETLSSEAVARFKQIKKDARTVAAQQIARLDQSMCRRRRWSREVFKLFLEDHPLMRHLVQRLVWGAWSGDTLVTLFRVAPDGGYTDSADDSITLPQDDAIVIGLPHALDIDPAQQAAFGQLFADYELLPPFTQLGRDTHALTADELSGDQLLRWQGKQVAPRSILNLTTKGWRRGESMGGGVIDNMTKPLPGGRVIELAFEPGIYVGDVDNLAKHKLTLVRTGPATSWYSVETAEPLSTLDAVAASELIRDIGTLKA